MLAVAAVRPPVVALFGGAGGKKQAPRTLPLGRQTTTKRLVPSASSEEAPSPVAIAAIGTGLLTLPVTLWSEVVYAQTGAGLDPGPFGLLGAAEGVGYLATVGIVAWSAYTKSTTGTGLPAGPSGLLGAVEGIAYLAALGGVVAVAVNQLT